MIIYDDNQIEKYSFVGRIHFIFRRNDVLACCILYKWFVEAAFKEL